MTSSDQWLNLFRAQPGRPGYSGAVEAARRFLAPRRDGSGHVETPGTQRLLDDLAAIPTRDRVGYDNPCAPVGSTPEPEAPARRAFTSPRW